MVHDLIHVHEERIQSIQEAAAAEKHYSPHPKHKSRLSHNGRDQVQQAPGKSAIWQQLQQQNYQRQADVRQPTPREQQGDQQWSAAQQDMPVLTPQYRQQIMQHRQQPSPQQTAGLQAQRIVPPVLQLQPQQPEQPRDQQQRTKKAQQLEQMGHHQQQQATLEKQLASAETEVTSLLQHLEDALAAQSTAERDLASSRSELTSLMAEAMQLKQQAKQAEQFSSTAATTVMQLQRELECAHTANEELVAEMMKLRRQLETHTADTTLAISKAEVVLLQQQLQESRRDNQAGEAAIEQMQLQLAAAAEDFAALATCPDKVLRLQQQLTDAQKYNQAATGAITDLQKRLNAAEAAAANLQDCQAELQHYKQHCEAAEARAGQAEDTAAQLQQQFQDVSRQLQAARTEVQQLQQKAVQAEQDSVAGSAMLLQLQQQFDEVSVARATLMQQHLELKQQTAKAGQERDTAAAESREAMQRLQQELASKEALTAVCSEAQAKAQQLQQRLEAAEAAHHSAATTVLELKEQLAKTETRVHDMEPKMFISLQEAEASKLKVQQLERALEWSQYNRRAKKSLQMDSQLKQLQRQLKDSQAAHAATRQQLHDAEQQMQLLREQQQQKAGRVSWSLFGQQDCMSSRDLKDPTAQPEHSKDGCMKLQSQESDSSTVVDLLRDELCRCRAELQEAKARLAWTDKHKVQHLLGLGRARKSSNGAELPQLGPALGSTDGGVGRGAVYGRLHTEDAAADAEVMRTPEPIRCQSRLGGIKGLSMSGSGLRASDRGLRLSNNGAVRRSDNSASFGNKNVGVLDVDGHGGGFRISTRYQTNDWPSACSSPVSSCM